MELLETYCSDYPSLYIGRELIFSDENYPDVFVYANNIEYKKYLIFQTLQMKKLKNSYNSLKN